MLIVLHRKFHNSLSIYVRPTGHSGSVQSPVSGKVISDKQWIQIITNNKLKKRDGTNWREVKGGYIESSLETFSRDFSSEVSKNPIKMIQLMLDNKDRTNDKFVDSLFSGVAFSEDLNNIPTALIEEMIITYPCDMASWRASYVCDIIGKRNNTTWNKEILELLKSIATKHINPELNMPNVTNIKDSEMKSCDMLQSNALNCIRGQAARAIGNLLWGNNELYSQFKDTVKILIKDVNPAVQYASLFALFPISNLDRQWASEKILELYEKDIRFATFHGSRDMFFYYILSIGIEFLK